MSSTDDLLRKVRGEVDVDQDVAQPVDQPVDQPADQVVARPGAQLSVSIDPGYISTYTPPTRASDAIITVQTFRDPQQMALVIEVELRDPTDQSYVLVGREIVDYLVLRRGDTDPVIRQVIEQTITRLRDQWVADMSARPLPFP